MDLSTGVLLLLFCFYLNSRRTSTSHADEAEDSEIERHIRHLDRQDRRARLLAPWQQPWPWWFLGPQLAFCLLAFVAGVNAYPHVDSYAMMGIGALFLLAFGFKAWAQEQALAHQARLHVRLAQLWQRVTRA